MPLPEDAPEAKSPAYGTRRVRFAAGEWQKKIRADIGETMITAAVTVITGGLSGYAAGSAAGGFKGGLIGSLVGGIGGPVIAALILLTWKWLVAPSALWKQQETVIQTLKATLEQQNQQITRQARFNRLTSLKEELDLKFGSASHLTPDGKFQRATVYFEGLESEVLAGDFTHAVEVLAIKDIILPTLARWFGTSTPGYADWHDRVVRVIELVTSHEEEIGLFRPPLPPS